MIYRLKRYLPVLIVAGLVIIAVSCSNPSDPPAQSSTPAIPATQPAGQIPSSSPPSGAAPAWQADGIIGAQEYKSTKAYGDYEMLYSTDALHLYVGIRAKTNGWVAIGIQPGRLMKDADIIFGLVKNGTATVYDDFSTGDFGPHPEDTDLGGSNDILSYGGKEEDGYTVIEFKRALNTDDKYDLPLNKGINKIIWAYGIDDVINLKHSKRGYGEILID